VCTCWKSIAGGGRYGASKLPSEDDTAAWYEMGCEMLEAEGIRQYEISNFARQGHESQHNLKYWRRLPYIGFGLDAHSMLPSLRDDQEAMRFQNTDDLNAYMENCAGGALQLISYSHTLAPEIVGREEAFEESLFLGLRLNEGVDFDALRERFGSARVQGVMAAVLEITEAGLIEVNCERVRLTAHGRMASNEVFSRLLTSAVA